MPCPFAQLSPVLLLSLLLLLINYGAALLPRPLASARGSRLKVLARAAAPTKEKCGASVRGKAPVLSPREDETALGRRPPFPDPDPLAGFPSRAVNDGDDGPLHYAHLLRYQMAAMQEGLGLERTACPDGLESACNPEKGSRILNLCYAGERVRKLRASYLDTPGMQVFTSLAYGHEAWGDTPLLGVSAMSMGRARVLAVDIQPLFPGEEYAERYRETVQRLAAIRERYPALAQAFVKDYYRDSPFFSDNMLYARWGPEEEASGFMDTVVAPAFREAVAAYVDLVGSLPPGEGGAAPEDPGGVVAAAVRARQGEFDRYHAEREQAHPVIKANFGADWADAYISRFLFTGASESGGAREPSTTTAAAAGAAAAEIKASAVA